MPAFRRLIGLPVYYEYELYDNTQHIDVKLLQVWVYFLCPALQLTPAMSGILAAERMW